MSFIAVRSKGDPNQEDGDTAPDPGKAAGTIGAFPAGPHRSLAWEDDPCYNLKTEKVQNKI